MQWISVSSQRSVNSIYISEQVYTLSLSSQVVWEESGDIEV